jgi:hypothetical protein
VAGKTGRAMPRIPRAKHTKPARINKTFETLIKTPLTGAVLVTEH